MAVCKHIKNHFSSAYAVLSPACEWWPEGDLRTLLSDGDGELHERWHYNANW